MSKITQLSLEEKQVKEELKNKIQVVKDYRNKFQDEINDIVKESIRTKNPELEDLNEKFYVQLADRSMFTRSFDFRVVDINERYFWSESIMAMEYEPFDHLTSTYENGFAEQPKELSKALKVNYGSGGWQKEATALDILKSQKYANIALTTVHEEISNNREEFDNKIKHFFNLHEVADEVQKKYTKIIQEKEKLQKIEEEKPVYEYLEDKKIGEEKAQEIVDSLLTRLESSSKYESAEHSFYSFKMLDRGEKTPIVSVSKHTIEGYIDGKNAIRFKYQEKGRVGRSTLKTINEGSIKRSELVNYMTNNNGYEYDKFLDAVYQTPEKVEKKNFIEVYENLQKSKDTKNLVEDIEKNGKKIKFK